MAGRQSDPEDSVPLRPDWDLTWVALPEPSPSTCETYTQTNIVHSIEKKQAAR